MPFFNVYLIFKSLNTKRREDKAVILEIFARVLLYFYRDRGTHVSKKKINKVIKRPLDRRK